MYVSDAVAAINATNNQDLPNLWNSILNIDALHGWPSASESDPELLSTWTDGLLATKSLHGCRGHVVDIRLLPLSRQLVSEGRTDYAVDPFTVDTLIGCDANGGSPVATLRLRCEHGKILSSTPLPGAWTTAALTTHSMSLHKDTPALSQIASDNWKMVELLVYLELVEAGGAVVDSFLVPQGIEINRKFGLFGVEWRVSLSDDSITVMAVSAESVHLFEPLATTAGVLSKSHLGVKFSRGKGLQLSFAHNPLTRSLNERVVEVGVGAAGHTENETVALAPATPSDLAPYCDPQHPSHAKKQDAQTWPFRLNDRCEYWTKSGRVAAATSAFSELALNIEFYGPGEAVEVGPDTYPSGVFNLGAISDSGEDLVDNSFWFAEDINETYPYGSGADVITASRIEWSAFLHWLPVSGIGGPARCSEEWAFLRLVGRVARNVPHMQPPLRSYFLYSIHTVGKSFFSGQEISLGGKLRWTTAAYYANNQLLPPASPWHFLADGSENPIGSEDIMPKKFTIQLVP
jgi:hypothetical protein